MGWLFKSSDQGKDETFKKLHDSAEEIYEKHKNEVVEANREILNDLKNWDRKEDKYFIDQAQENYKDNEKYLKDIFSVREKYFRLLTKYMHESLDEKLKLVQDWYTYILALVEIRSEYRSYMGDYGAEIGTAEWDKESKNFQEAVNIRKAILEEIEKRFDTKLKA